MDACLLVRARPIKGLETLSLQGKCAARHSYWGWSASEPQLLRPRKRSGTHLAASTFAAELGVIELDGPVEAAVTLDMHHGEAELVL